MANSTIYCFGEVLWDVFPDAKHPGGAPMNVSLHLNNLGKNVFMLSKVGNDELGDEILNFIQGKKASIDLIQKDSQYPTGTVDVQISSNGNATYTISEPVAWDFIEVPEGLIDSLSAQDYLVYGSLAARQSHSFNTLSKLLTTPVTKIFDINLRAPHYQREKLETLLHSADILKLNEDEIEVIKPWFYPNLSNLDDITHFLLEHFKLKGVIVTLGADGAMVNFSKQTHLHAGLEITVADTVGSGDAFLAGFISKYVDGVNVADCLAFGCATGALVATFHGANPTYTVADIENLYQQKS